MLQLIIAIVVVCAGLAGCSPQSGNQDLAAPRSTTTDDTRAAAPASDDNDVSIRMVSSQQAPQPTTDDQITIAVVGFADKGPSIALAPLRIALAEMIASDFSKYQGLRSVERVRITQLFTERELDKAGFVDLSRSEKMGQTLAADYLFVGTFSGNENRVSVEASLLKPGNDAPVCAWQASASKANFLKLEEQLATSVLQFLGVSRDALRPRLESATDQTPSVAVLAFRNLGTDSRLSSMEDGFADILQANLSVFENIQLIEREEIHKILEEQSLQLTALSDPATAVQIGQLIKCERLIYGSFLEINGQLRVIVRIVDVGTTNVVASKMISSNTHEFSDLIRTLATEVVEALAVQPPDNVGDLVQASLPARQLESAVHYAEAKKFFRTGHTPNAVNALKQAILVEPENVLLKTELVNALYFSREYAEARDVATTILATEFPIGQEILKKKVTLQLLEAYRRLKQNEEYVALAKRAMKEFQGNEIETAFRTHLGIALFAQHKFQEAVELFDTNSALPQNAVLSDGEIQSLRTLCQLLDVHAQWKDVVPDEKIREQCAVLESQIAPRIIAACRGRRDQIGREIATDFLQEDFKFSWMDNDHEFHATLNKAQQKKLRNESFQVFAWTLDQDPDAYYEVAKRQFKSEEYEAALESFERYLLIEQPPKIGAIPGWLDSQFVQPGEVIDKQVEAFYRVALAREELYKIAPDTLKENRLGELQKALQDYVQDVGLVNFHGPQVAEMIDSLGIEPAHPSHAVLLWGGGTESLSSYKNLFQNSDYTFHSVRTRQITPAQLYPYRLIVLLRTGAMPYSPSDILALRSYVATGGSLLVITSPGWEPAAPSLHNSLLSLFDVSADSELIVRANSTTIKPHAITGGTTKAMAKCACALNCPPEFSLIESDGKTVLAAIPYRHGRVVVASFGQWFFPDPNTLYDPWWLSLRSSHPTISSVDRRDLPIGIGQERQVELLRNVFSWLMDDSRRDDSYRQQRENIEMALSKAYRVYGWILDWKYLAPAMERMVAEAEPGLWKEEALWLAGETCQQMVYQANNGFCNQPNYGYGARYILEAEPSFYRQLTEQFSDSPLNHFAQWRLGECERRAQINAHFRVSHPFADAREADPQAAIDVFKKVTAPAGSYPWVWTQLRIGLLLVRDHKLDEAVTYFSRIAETMPAGPERGIALLTLNECLKQLGRPQEAERYRQAALADPDISWTGNHSYTSWAPLTADGRGRFRRTTKKLANEDSAN